MTLIEYLNVGLSLSDSLQRLQTLRVAHCVEVSLMIGAGPKHSVTAVAGVFLDQFNSRVTDWKIQVCQ